MYLQNVFELIADVDVLLIVVDLWVMSNQGVLGTNIDGVVNLPVDVSHLPGRMEQTLQRQTGLNNVVRTYPTKHIYVPSSLVLQL